jgi:hypothetical protein
MRPARALGCSANPSPSLPSTFLCAKCLQVGIILVGQRLVLGLLHLLLVLSEELGVDLDLGGSQSGSSDEFLVISYQWRLHAR